MSLKKFGSWMFVTQARTHLVTWHIQYTYEYIMDSDMYFYFDIAFL